MIIYSGTKQSFLADTDNRDIEDVVSAAYLKRTGRYVPHAEIRSWRHSLERMSRVLRDEQMPNDIGVGIEYGIPQTAKRIDFILTGTDLTGKPNLIIVELKQWSTSKLCDKDGIIIADRGGGVAREGAHPSYQAWSYAALLEGFNEAVYDTPIELKPCAYLHNYVDDGIINDPFYAPYLEKAPVFLKGEEELEKLRAFIRSHVRNGDKGELLYKVENGRIRPSKMLADSLAKMLKGNREFVLIDDQKVVFEESAAKAKRASANRKEVVIVRGGPGTGKSVVAINLLVELTKSGLLAKYVSKNAAPRAVYRRSLQGQVRIAVFDGLFSGSGSFTESEPESLDVIVADEAHRLNEFSGLYGNLGENQIKEIISTAKCTIFFVDDDQIVTLKDIGTTEEIAKWSGELGANITDLDLSSQFRCNGSDGYLAWLDNALQIRETANKDLDGIDFDFKVFDSPVELHEAITKHNKPANKSRVVAGYCWDWKSKRDPDAYDIVMPEFGYKRQWNLSTDGSLWIIGAESIDQVGCIHTCQGLELDYVGVILGPDLIVRDGAVLTDPTGRSNQDRSIRGYKTLMRSDPVTTLSRVDRIIRNTYRTLMTRGMKGCYIYSVDDETREYFKSAMA